MTSQLSTFQRTTAAATGLYAAALLTQRLNRRRALRTRVAEVMSREVISVHPAEPIERVAELLAERGLGAVPVCDADQRLLGILTDRDIVVRVTAQRADPAELRAGDCAHANPLSVGEDESLGVALDRMCQGRVRRLPVMRGRRVVGIVSHADLSRRVHMRDAASLERSLLEGEPDALAGAWLFERAYGENRRARTEQRRRAAEDGELTHAVKEILSDR